MTAPRPTGPASSDDDATLLRQYVADRDPAAYAELVRRYEPLVRGACRRRCGR